MTQNAVSIRPAQVEFFDGGLRSAAYDDGYFMSGQGPAESESVFIDGNDLPARFSQMASGELFVIGENGFGSGLNVLLAAECFHRHAAPGSWLRLFSTELHPLSRDDLAKALADHERLRPWVQALLEGYPPSIPGYHRIVLGRNVELILMFGEAGALWSQAELKIDTWFLDGFAPSRNPAMWQPALLSALGRCSKPGATLSTFTAAGEVRRGLEAAGFEVQRVPGFAHKRHRLQARWPGSWKPSRRSRGRAIVAGAGLAGATTARALADCGWQVQVIDREGPASGASGNHAGVLYTTPSSHLTPQNRFYQSAFVRAQSWLRQHGFPQHADQGRLNDVIQWPTDDKHRDKLRLAVESQAWPKELLRERDDGAFVLIGGGFLRPAGWVQHLLDHPGIDVQTGEIESLRSSDEVRLTSSETLSADAVILCLAHHAARLPGLDWLFIKTIRGQVTECAPGPASRFWTQAECHGGYLTPALDGRHCVGATYDLKRPETGIDPADDPINLEQLKHFLPQRWEELGGDAIQRIGHRASARCQSPDFLPQAGALPDPRQLPHDFLSGVFLNIGHGSRGLTHTPLCADLIAEQLSGLPASVEPALIQALAPERFVHRQRKRQPNWPSG